MGRPSGTRSKDTQQRILDAAERAFAEVGFEGARLQEIGASAGVTKAMVHYYFESKDHLYQAVLDRVLFGLIKLVQDVTSRGGDRVQQLDHFVQGFFLFVASHPHFARLGFAGGAAEKRYFDTIIAQFFHPLLRRGVRFINKGIKEGVFRPADPEQLLLAMYFFATGYFSDARFISLVSQQDAVSAASIDKAKEALRTLMFRYLGIEPPARPGAKRARSAPRRRPKN